MINPTPTGMLITKIDRQPIPKASRSTSTPDSTGPTTLAVPVMKPTNPKTGARDSGG